MISEDKDFFHLVKNIANNSANTRENILLAAGYLWDSYNWERLKETACGRFLREVHNNLPDYTLRSVYREEVLTEK